MNELSIIKVNGGAYIDSREVAEIIGKRHDHLLRDIAKYREIIARGGLPKIGESDFFVESRYLNAQNKAMPCYLITKRGAEVIANKLTGERGILFTFAYVSRFNEMEAAERAAEIKSYARPRLSEFNSAVRNVLSGMSYSYTNPNRVMGFLRGVYEPLGIAISDDANDKRHYSATQIARLLNVYSCSGRPHSHAVAAIIAKLDNWASHTVAVPYGLINIMLRYDWSIVDGVRNWLAENNSPSAIPHLDFYYHIYRHKQMSLFDFDDTVGYEADDATDLDDFDDDGDDDFFEHYFTDEEMASFDNEAQ